MIQFADQHTLPQIRQMWKICFGDSDEYIDLYFGEKYRHENTLVYMEQDTAVASLQMLSYDVRFYGEAIPCAYIAGACTLPSHRGKGLMKHLLNYSFEVMRQRNIPLSILIPAEDWLYAFYGKCGYTQTFDQGTEAIDLQGIIDRHPNDFKAAYAEFDARYQQHDFCVLKTEADFRTIVREYFLDSSEEKRNLAGMARIINAQELLACYARKNSNQTFVIKVTDHLLAVNNATFEVSNAGVKPCDENRFDFETDVATLSRLLWGYHTSELDSPIALRFSEQHPVMNLMLE